MKLPILLSLVALFASLIPVTADAACCGRSAGARRVARAPFRVFRRGAPRAVRGGSCCR